MVVQLTYRHFSVVAWALIAALFTAVIDFFVVRYHRDGWWLGRCTSVVRRMNEVNLC